MKIRTSLAAYKEDVMLKLNYFQELGKIVKFSGRNLQIARFS